MRYPSPALLSIVSAWPLPPRWGGRGAAGTSLCILQLLSGAELSRQTMAGAAGSFPSVPGPSWDSRRGSKPSQAARWPGIPSTTFLAGLAWLCFYADEPCASHWKAFHRKRRFLCLVLGGRLGAELGWGDWERDYGERPPRPLPPPALRHHNTTTRAHTLGVIHSVPRLL